MSIESWKEEFYPISAHKVLPFDALEHSLRKWEGFRDENLAKHGLDVSRHFGIKQDFINEDEAENFIGVNTCACCVHWYTKGCVGCPLYHARNDQKCYMGDESPYTIFQRSADPEPMIALIEKAINNE